MGDPFIDQFQPKPDPLNKCDVKYDPLDEETSPSPTSWPPKLKPTLLNETDIFERSLSTVPFQQLPPRKRSSKKLSCMSPDILKDRSMSIVSMDSQVSGKLMALHHSTEDFIPPVLDLTAEILTDPLIDLDSINVVCCDCEGSTCQKPTRTETQSRQRNKSVSSCRPRLRSHSRSGSFICNSLMSALPPEPANEEDSPQGFIDEGCSEDADENKTINFYSFNDVLNGEKESERFNTFRMSKLLS